MRSLVFASLVLLVSAAAAQQPANTPPPQQSPPPPSSTPPPQRSIPVSTQVVRPRAVDPRLMVPQFPLNPVSESDMLAARVVVLNRIVAPLYRKPSEKDLAELSPSSAALQKYAAFLKNEDSGIFRLVPDRGCVYSERVVSAKEECLKYQFPGAGNSYSFRSETYRLRHLADITFADGKLQITGIFMHGIVTELGDVPIENATLSTKGMEYITGFAPSTSSAEVVTVENRLRVGIRVGGFSYAKEVEPHPDTTYALRVVAYRGKVARSAGGVRYNELDYDRRRDIIVTFRIVEMDPERGVTIVWKKLSEAESPKIRMPKEPEENEAEDGN